jgi:hypothetical protein
VQVAGDGAKDQKATRVYIRRSNRIVVLHEVIHSRRTKIIKVVENELQVEVVTNQQWQCICTQKRVDEQREGRGV